MSDGLDYYEIYSEGEPGIHGCCLLCDDAKPGCLCYDCKCSKCCWYEFDSDMGKVNCTFGGN